MRCVASRRDRRAASPLDDPGSAKIAGAGRRRVPDSRFDQGQPIAGGCQQPAAPWSTSPVAGAKARSRGPSRPLDHGQRRSGPGASASKAFRSARPPPWQGGGANPALQEKGRCRPCSAMGMIYCAGCIAPRGNHGGGGRFSKKTAWGRGASARGALTTDHQDCRRVGAATCTTMNSDHSRASGSILARLPAHSTTAASHSRNREHRLSPRHCRGAMPSVRACRLVPSWACA